MIDQNGIVVRLSFAKCDGVCFDCLCLTHITMIPIPPHAQVPAMKAAYVTAWLRAIKAAQTETHDYTAHDDIILDELGFCLEHFKDSAVVGPLYVLEVLEVAAKLVEDGVVMSGVVVGL